MVDGARTAAVIDDDPDVRLMLRVALEAIGFVVHEAETGHGGVDLVAECEPDLVTLDLMLPGFGGVEVCRRIRQTTTAYIIMITGSLDEVDRLVGLATGADDYVTKPFSPREVQARVSAMFRRPRAVVATTGDPLGLIAPALPSPPPYFGPIAAPGAGPPDHFRADLGVRGPDPGYRGTGSVPPPRSSDPAAPNPAALNPGASNPAGGFEHGMLRHSRLTMDTEARVAWYGDIEMPLTKIEFDLLATMVGNPRRVWRRETLLNIVWGGQWSDYHVVEVHIGNLRRKLGDATPDGALLIKTVRGIGYRMASVDSHSSSGF
jgi:two-component system OmpR family response regulator